MRYQTFKTRNMKAWNFKTESNPTDISKKLAELQDAQDEKRWLDSITNEKRIFCPECGNEITEEEQVICEECGLQIKKI